MKLSLQYYSFIPLLKKGKINFEDILSFAANNEFDAIEYLLLNANNDVMQIKDLLNKYKQKISCVDFFIDLTSLQRSEFNKQIELAYFSIDKALDLDAEMVMVIPVYEKDIQNINVKDLKENIILGLEKIVKYGSEKGILVTIENLPSLKTLMCSIEDVGEILQRIPELKLTFDTGNFLIAEDSVLDAYNVFKERIANIHAKDFRIEKSGEGLRSKNGIILSSCIHGAGVIPFQKLFKYLNRDGYNKYVSLEYENDLDNTIPLSQASKYLRNLKKTMYKED